MGVSMGSMIAQQYALDYPFDLLSLALACTYAA
jgi:pimeloyl-ACP methyl ester carboxylesterase